VLLLLLLGALYAAGVSFFSALAEGANFKGANMAVADLESGNFEDADFTDAVLEGAFVNNAQLKVCVLVDGACGIVFSSRGGGVPARYAWPRGCRGLVLKDAFGNNVQVKIRMHVWVCG
jgi:uncharacterized protein YjbI with pentapeptide repeats